MDGPRVIWDDQPATPLRCSCCRKTGSWDRIGKRVYCPNCQEAVITGNLPPLKMPTDKIPCAACGHMGAVLYHTLPHEKTTYLVAALCGEHLRALLERRLGPFAFGQLRRRLAAVDLKPADVFLLHDAFYDERGRWLKPVIAPL